MLARGQQCIEWTDERGLIIGHAQVRSLEDGRIDFHFRFFGTTNVEVGIGPRNLALRSFVVNENVTKTMMACRQCGRSCQRIYYVRGDWSCSRCQGLVSITQRLGVLDRVLYDKAQIEAKLAAVKETKRNAAKRAILRRKRDALIRKLREEEVTDFSPQLRFRSRGRWLGTDEMPLIAPAPGAIGYGWEPGDFGLRGVYREPRRELVEELLSPSGPLGPGEVQQPSTPERVEPPEGQGHRVSRIPFNKPKIPFVSPFIGGPQY
ncbi:hypothetical protein HMF7854_11265 [Sphingomonas ginkgonis]|uniref:Uncharacterized protein n=2 Tax=Sphingomonas ginkgonis TaxID=2315330 RepID=A0A3R9WR05_9SPHN|nr:hypothetical protein HMF7854_11265 [Sphingomonas ginkgonis]